ncbi:MAG: hypothetical protein HZA50_02395 [Planctomycetes bacterium]|nr:hypothetical protein [Planctomycetota bacterium]
MTVLEDEKLWCGHLACISFYKHTGWWHPQAKLHRSGAWGWLFVLSKAPHANAGMLFCFLKKKTSPCSRRGLYEWFADAGNEFTNTPKLHFRLRPSFAKATAGYAGQVATLEGATEYK